MVCAATMLSYALVDGFTQASRQEAMSGLKTAIADADGVIVDFAFYKGAIRLSVDLEAGAIGRLRDALERCGVQVFERCAKALDRAAAPNSTTSPVIAMLHVAFASDLDLSLSAAPSP